MAVAKYDNVIVFGPTGSVGGNAALEASKHGAKVWLAMRDPSKPIDDIPAEVEKTGKFSRVKADLTDPASLAEAIKVSGAKAAYFYLAYGRNDHMRASLQALRDAGVEYVVFLSSASIQPDVNIRDIKPEELIPYAHAQVEVAVEEVGFPYFTALRPFSFASNFFKVNLDRSTKPPRANIVHLDSWVDNIVPEDIGAVGGAVLVDRPSDKSKEVIYLFGPVVRTLEESWTLIKKITGRDDIDTTPVSEEEFLGRLQKNVPAPIANYLVKTIAVMRDKERLYPKSLQVPSSENVKRYTGREATKFEDYLEAHKAEWQAV